MSKYLNKFWASATAVLTVLLIAYLFPVLKSKYGLAAAILLSLVLVFGMSLYYLRGILISQSWRRQSQASVKKGNTDGSNGMPAR